MDSKRESELLLEDIQKNQATISRLRMNVLEHLRSLSGEEQERFYRDVPHEYLNKFTSIEHIVDLETGVDLLDMGIHYRGDVILKDDLLREIDSIRDDIGGGYCPKFQHSSRGSNGGLLYEQRDVTYEITCGWIRYMIDHGVGSINFDW